MKKFNEIITVEVEVDTIATMLLDSMSSESKHKELIVEAIIGRYISEDKSGLGHVYSALHGVKYELNFKVGETIQTPNCYAYGFWEQQDIDNNNSSRVAIQKAKIVEIREYANAPLKIQYEVPNKKKELETRTEWIRLSDATKLPKESSIEE